ncbi:hypothetical protein SAM23877_4368 [Streptomyces ambofaciens ATCC 23877]|uniref:DUF4279 domain-containing protein n=1 Tax=Streptomyces ambofaciens (strain ATCC 23877 / 3486 / DSM 40053 / JCM 4204 / NBRC 12836 / NRRL B-2516) TaxID=278992 RepID=A0A0K2AWP7_STRA7|nr:DUF4279 domain-containing protein [Streptomyces ambofaciens]AKZ57413.1 hypothetical protein SAM23877_4368 [Streptomyces ambofaciens ATCC 23877]
MQWDHEEGTWAETGVQLIVRKPDLDSSLLSEVIRVPPTSLSVPEADSRRTDPPPEGVWALAVHKRYPGGVNEQLLKLLEQIEPYSSGINHLTAQGYELSISVTGFVGNGSSFSLTPDVVSRMAALNVPLTISPSTSDR